MTERESINPFKDNMVGRTLAGRYRIVRKLATGGMGVVYLARAEGAAGFAKPVVVKLILPNYAENKEFSGMFIREAMILSHLRDPGIVGVVEFSEEGGCYLMVLEYVNGFQLREWNKFRKSKGYLIPTGICIHIMVSVLDALHYAHTLKRPDGSIMQVIHRDISPGNIMIDTDGRARLVDFGIALVTDASFGHLTQTESFKGKLSYAAPELFKNEKASVVSDVYACGVSLHEILLGRSDFRTGNHVTTLSRVLSHTPCSVLGQRPDAPRDLDIVLRKAMAKDPAHRYRNAAEFADALRMIFPYNERELQSQLADLVRQDFTEEMAEFLGVESLDSRDRAWRNPSSPPEPISSSDEISEPPSHKTPTTINEEFIIERSTTRVTLSPEEQQMVARSSLSLKLAIGTLILTIALVVGGVAFLGLGGGDDKSKIVIVQSPVAETNAASTVPSIKTPTKPLTGDTASISEVDSAETAGAIDSPADLGDQRAVKQPKGNKKRRAGNTEGNLSEAFKRQEAEIRNCFRQHALNLQGKPKITILFDVGRKGNVTSAELSPARLRKTALGKCLETVAKKTRFPKQKEAISFRIPVTIWRVQK